MQSADRIVELLELDDDDFEEGDLPIDVDSAWGFEQFIPRFPHLGEPEIGLFSQVTLSISWRLADNKHMLLEFLDRKQIAFALIGPDDKAPDKKFHTDGHGTHSQVIKTLCDLGVTEW